MKTNGGSRERAPQKDPDWHHARNHLLHKNPEAAQEGGQVRRRGRRRAKGRDQARRGLARGCHRSSAGALEPAIGMERRQHFWQLREKCRP